MPHEMTELVDIYKWPSEAFWRSFELRALREVKCESPILEIGCGNGRFSALIFDKIDEAIDINPRAVESCRRIAGHLYDSVRSQDARTLEPRNGGYGTIYANSVLEHIPDLEGVLESCYRALRPGGQLVITVPLKEMNHHLMLPFQWYSRMRQRQLLHLNLLSEAEWRSILARVKFSSVTVKHCLPAAACKLWDRLDGIACLGMGRYRAGAVMRLIFDNALPRRSQQLIKTAVAGWLDRRMDIANGGPPCNALVIARK